MAKLMTFVMVTVGLMVLMNLAGLQTTSGYILGSMGINIGNIQNFSSTSFYIAILAALAALLVTGAGIRVTGFGLTSSSFTAGVAAATPLAVLVGDLVSIVVQASATGLSWVSYLIFLIIVPFVFGYMISLFDWARGID